MALTFVRPEIRRMAGYVPGEQPAAGERVIKLNTNENPFPPSERVLKAIREVDGEMLRRYPNPSAAPFREAAANVLGVSPQMVATGNGSDDVLAFALQTFVAPGQVLAYPHPTYSLYPVLSELDDVKDVAVPWDKDWQLPIDALLAASPKAIFLANPNAPSGTIVPAETMEKLLKRFDGLLLIDEAYVSFAEEDCLALVRKYANVIVVRTLSKAYSLAGLRFGYAVGPEPVITEMNKARDSYPCDAISIAAATAAMEDQEYAKRTWEHVKSERQRVTEALTELGWAVIPSSANFVLAAVPGGKAREMYERLKAHGILVRFFDKPGLNDKLRITIGTGQENNALLGVIKSADGGVEQAA